jgi:hypothetical protein
MKHFLNDIEISPRNRTDIGIVSDFTGNPDVLRLTTDNIILPREGNQIIRNHIQTQGLFEGVPYRIELDGGVVLNYYIDLLDASTKFKNFECEVALKKRKGQDDFFDKASGATFEWFLSKGVTYNLESIPYVVVSENQTELAISLFISLYVMGKELLTAGQELVASVSEVIQATTPSVGVGVVIDTGDVIVAVLKAVARLLYFSLVLALVIDLATQLFQLMFPPIRYFSGCKFKELMVKSCQHFGFTFESTLLDAYPNFTVLPVPLVKNRQSIFNIQPAFLNNAFNKGVPSSSDTTPTLQSFLEGMEIMFNARTKVNNGVVRFERRDWWMNQTTNQILPALSLQSERDDEFQYNTDDVWKRYYMHYQTDFTDFHSVDGTLYDIHNCEFSTEPTSFINQDLVSIKGLQDVNIPFALGARKEKLNWLEDIAKKLAKVIDSVTGVFGGGTNYEATIGDRKNILMVSKQFFATTKVLWTVNGRQPINFKDKVSAINLWNQFHFINQIQENDWILKNDVRLQMTSNDFVTLQDNNFAEIDGLMCEILSCEWIDEKSFAKITYRERNTYSAGKVVTIQINA